MSKQVKLFWLFLLWAVATLLTLSLTPTATPLTNARGGKVVYFQFCSS